uniref:Uncharacterized protein n=1 Tax=Arundo donax TaxID=35708 RepID=A0A0A9EYE2_ARUDO
MEPSASRTQRESPTDATVTTDPSIMTSVTVVPDECAETNTPNRQVCHQAVDHLNMVTDVVVLS